MNQMVTIQAVASLLVMVLREGTGWVEDLRDTVPSSVFEQLEQGLVVKFRNGIPRSIVTAYGEWQIIGRFSILPNELAITHERLTKLVSLSLERLEGANEAYAVLRFENEPIAKPLYRMHRSNSLEARNLWERDLRWYLSHFGNQIKGREVSVKGNGVLDRVSPSKGRRVIVNDLSPYGIATVTEKGMSGVKSQIPVTSLMVFRDGLVR